VKALETHLFRPMYAGANMGHPSREEGFVLCSNRSAAHQLHRVLPHLTDFQLPSCEERDLLGPHPHHEDGGSADQAW
jgi:hypothetical protein